MHWQYVAFGLNEVKTYGKKGLKKSQENPRHCNCFSDFIPHLKDEEDLHYIEDLR